MSTGTIVLLCVLAPLALALIAAVVLWFWPVGRDAREAALERQMDALKRAQHLGAEFFHAREAMRQEARSAHPSGRAHVGRASVPRDYIDGEWS